MLQRGVPVLLAALAAASAAFAKPVSRCPKGTRAVQTADSRKPWACALSDERYRDGIDCPPGHEPVTTLNPNDPFKCAQKGLQVLPPRGLCPPGHHAVPTSDESKDYDCEKLEKGFSAGPRCPRGTLPVPTPGAMSPFKCVRQERADDPDPSVEPVFRKPGAGAQKTGSGDKGIRCPPGQRRVPTEDPFNPFECLSPKPAKPVAAYRSFRREGEVSFDIPRDWSLTDAWSDETPSIYLLTESGREGRPVSLSVSRQQRGAPSFQEMQAMISREIEWHGAKVVGRGKLDGLGALHLAVEKESRTAFLETGDGYYVVSYNSPPEAFERHLAAYERLLSSFRRIAKRKGKSAGERRRRG